MLPTEEQKLSKIRQDMIALGHIALELNEAVLEKLEQNDIEHLKALRLASKKEWYAKISAIDSSRKFNA